MSSRAFLTPVRCATAGAVCACALATFRGKMVDFCAYCTKTPGKIGLMFVHVFANFWFFIFRPQYLVVSTQKTAVFRLVRHKILWLTPICIYIEPVLYCLHAKAIQHSAPRSLSPPRHPLVRERVPCQPQTAGYARDREVVCVACAENGDEVAGEP